MNPLDREGLVGRIRQMRRQAASVRPAPEQPEDLTRLELLENRVAHAEEMLRGLQDSIYRESQRQDRRIAELEAQIEPSAMATALSRDARERGL